MRQRRWLELLKDYDINIQCHPRKANVVADALSRKSGMIAGIKVEEEIIRDLERLDIELYVRGQHGDWACLRVEPDLISRIKEAQKEDNEIWTIVENLDEQTEFCLDEDDVLWQGTRLCVPNDTTLREALLTEAHSSPFSLVKIEHQRASGLLQPLDIPVWKWDEISMDFVTGLPRTQRRHDAIWVVVDRLIRLVVPNDASLREALLTEAHSSSFFVHPGSMKMYHDLKQHFWWSGMKRDVAMFVSKCLICQQVKIEHQRASGLLQPLDIPVWKWDEISMDFVTGLPQNQRRHDAIWVVVDRLTKSAHFLPIRKDYSVSRLAAIFQQEIVRLHGTPSAIVSDRDPRFASCFWKGRKCRAPICWDQVGEHVIEGPDMIERVQVSSSSCYFISTRSDPYRFILGRRTGGYFGSSRQSHEEKDYSFRQDSLEEPSLCVRLLGVLLEVNVLLVGIAGFSILIWLLLVLDIFHDLAFRDRASVVVVIVQQVVSEPGYCGLEVRVLVCGFELIRGSDYSKFQRLDHSMLELSRTVNILTGGPVEGA
nr:retrotransposable element Tf2 [Tanacetum cinerariifolium]